MRSTLLVFLSAILLATSGIACAAGKKGRARSSAYASCPVVYNCKECKREGGTCRVDEQGNVHCCRANNDLFSAIDCPNEVNVSLREANDDSRRAKFENDPGANYVEFCDGNGPIPIYNNRNAPYWGLTTRTSAFAIVSSTASDGWEEFVIGEAYDEQFNYVVRDY